MDNNSLVNFKMIDSVVQTATDDDFSVYDMSGRKSFWQQGYTGKDVIVGIGDTGVTNHPDLINNIIDGKNFIYSENSPYTDDNGHGTATASCVKFIAPDVKIVSAKMLDIFGSGSLSNVLNGLYYFRDWKRPETGARIDIVSLSLSIQLLNQSDIELFHTAIKSLTDLGIIVICSSGNTSIEDIRYPACFHEPITVGAVDKDKKTAYFSTKSSEVDVCQVGTDVFVAYFKGGYTTMSGTSFSTPIVAGIASLLVSKYKALFKTYMPENALYEMLKMNTLDVSTAGVDKETGAGFCTLNPSANKVVLQINNTAYTVNGQTFYMDTTPIIDSNGRTIVPVRFVAEALGHTVSWDGIQKAVTIE